MTYIFAIHAERLRVLEEIIDVCLEARHNLEDEFALKLEFSDVILVPNAARLRKTSSRWRD